VEPVTRPRVATVWLGGCSGCHMSLLDMDERLLDLAARMELVYSPLMDIKEFPNDVDITLVEGAVANEDNARMLRLVRERTDVLVAFGDCAVAGNVTALRNPLGSPLPVLTRAYGTDVSQIPGLGPHASAVPPLVDKVQMLRGLVAVDYYLPGCPPSADLIFFVLSELIAGRTLDLRSRAKLG
jgi:NAD-reducing hydrogenase small subunit